MVHADARHVVADLDSDVPGPFLEILQTMPVTDRTAAAAILAGTGPDMSMFPSALAFASWS